ncbi:MAG: hypothetical protein V1738_04250 [Patescibacteria group bacterium]
MNKTNLIIIISVLAVGVLGAMIYFLSTPKGLVPTNGRQDAKIDVLEEQHTLSDYLFGGALSTGLKCEYTVPISEQGTFNVSTYIDGGRVAVSYAMIPPLPGQGDMHMVSDTKFAYTWGDAYKANGMKGFKIDLSEEPDEQTESNSPIDYDEPLDNCVPWQPNDEVFMVPADMEFQTFDEMMGGMQFDLSGSADTTEGISGSAETDADAADPCAVCDMLAADQKTSCLQAMGCN